MNGSYYKTPVFINDIDNRETKDYASYDDYVKSTDPNSNYNYPVIEQSYIENILRNNIGKRVRAFVSFPDSIEWKDKIFTGVIEHAGRDNLIINDTESNNSYLILMIYLNYVEFDEKITYAK